MRKIIHIDCDCFYAAIEERDNPDLKGYPVAVGGRPDGRGVLSTCNYEARAYGLHSAMPASQALRLCPDLILVPHRFEAYKEASRQIHQVFRNFTETIEPLSLDEAYLDVTGLEIFDGSATLIAREIKQEVLKAVGITVSAGVAPNKFLAKVASDWNKPDGLFVITPDDVDEFIKALPVKKIPGVGQSTLARLQQINVETCEDLQAFTLHALVKRFGAFGQRLFYLSRGQDQRKVVTSRPRKSLSVETTFRHDAQTINQTRFELIKLYFKFRLRFAQLDVKYKVTRIFVKIKFADFTKTSVEITAESFCLSLFNDLLLQGMERFNKPVRLIGVGVRLEEKPSHQLELFMA